MSQFLTKLSTAHPRCPIFYIETSVIMEKHLALIKATHTHTHTRHPPFVALVAAAVLSASLPVSPPLIPPHSFTFSAHLELAASPSSNTSCLPPPSLFCKSLLRSVWTPHHDTCGLLRLGSLLVPVSEFRMDGGSADQLHQVRSQCEEDMCASEVCLPEVIVIIMYYIYYFWVWAKINLSS